MGFDAFRAWMKDKRCPGRVVRRIPDTLSVEVLRCYQFQGHAGKVCVTKADETFTPALHTKEA